MPLHTQHHQKHLCLRRSMMPTLTGVSGNLVSEWITIWCFQFHMLHTAIKNLDDCGKNASLKSFLTLTLTSSQPHMRNSSAMQHLKDTLSSRCNKSMTSSFRVHLNLLPNACSATLVRSSWRTKKQSAHRSSVMVPQKTATALTSTKQTMH